MLQLFLINSLLLLTKSVIFLNEVLRAITYYLRNDLKKAEEIFKYVYENDPNIFNKKYDNDWVNIDLMMYDLRFNNEQKSNIL